MTEVTDTVKDVLGVMGIQWGIVSVDTLVRAGIMLLVGIIVIRILMGITDRMLDRAKNVEAIRIYIRSALHVGLWFLLALMVVGSLGVDVTSIIALLSVAGLAVSLALQNTLSNLAGGIQVLVSKPFAVGDYVETDKGTGTVSQIGLAYTKLVTADNKAVLIPNSQMATSNIVNYTALGQRRLDIKVTAAYDSPTDTVRQAGLAAVGRFPQVLQDPAPQVLVSQYQPSAIEYIVRMWVGTDDYLTVQFGVTEALRDTFHASGVEMTYNHLNVHLCDKTHL